MTLHSTTREILTKRPSATTACRRTTRAPNSSAQRTTACRFDLAWLRSCVADTGERVELVFAPPNGPPIDPQRDWTEWKVLLREAGVRDARLHDARHTAATLLLTQGVAVRVAMAILGHSSSQLTRDTYQHVVPELARDAMDLVGSALWRREPAAVPSDRKNR
jgi:integrase